jgi:hypothetical protein
MQGLAVTWCCRGHGRLGQGGCRSWGWNAETNASPAIYVRAQLVCLGTGWFRLPAPSRIEQQEDSVPRTCMRSSPWALNTVGWSVFYLKPSPDVVDGLAAAEWQYARSKTAHAHQKPPICKLIGPGPCRYSDVHSFERTCLVICLLYTALPLVPSADGDRLFGHGKTRNRSRRRKGAHLDHCN